MSENIRIIERKILSKNFGSLEEITFERQRFDQTREKLTREYYYTDEGAAILLYDRARSTVLLVRQFRLPAYLGDHRESMIEVCAGRLEGADPQSRIIMEAEEETGVVVKSVRQIFQAYASPGIFAEKLYFFVAEYEAKDKTGTGGGLADEGEDIEILEPTLNEALAMIETGEIIDMKTILLLQYAHLHGLLA
jgi:nudix-type nucleoside diphosphatase (YffH/AdpP family)